MKRSALFLSVGAVVMLLASAATGRIGSDLEHRQGVDASSVVGCFESCVDMIAGLEDMTNTGPRDKHEERIAAMQDRCGELFARLSPEEQQLVRDQAEDLFATCLPPPLCEDSGASMCDGLCDDPDRECLPILTGGCQCLPPLVCENSFDFPFPTCGGPCPDPLDICIPAPIGTAFCVCHLDTLP